MSLVAVSKMAEALLIEKRVFGIADDGRSLIRGLIGSLCHLEGVGGDLRLLAQRERHQCPKFDSNVCSSGALE
jgi:hypothetical protein